MSRLMLRRARHEEANEMRRWLSSSTHDPRPELLIPSLSRDEERGKKDARPRRNAQHGISVASVARRPVCKALQSLDAQQGRCMSVASALQTHRAVARGG